MIRFLNKNLVLKFHKDQIKLYGGKDGVRDENLLDSDLSQQQASFDGEYILENIFHMAAAYGFHICQNHPFFDGNKRTALIAMYTFMYVNGYQITADKKSLYAIIIDLASGNVDKTELAEYLKDNSTKLKK